ncbi:MAG: hypothetical protein HY203_10525 [Nitrospirae bacterium]|nr:hypothetical protein [Nitrospirota bacterium]
MFAETSSALYGNGEAPAGKIHPHSAEFTSAMKFTGRMEKTDPGTA